jgi:general secretion pathway protein A
LGMFEHLVKELNDHFGSGKYRFLPAGGARSIIDAAAVNAIAGFCQGTPRLIDNLMTDALTLGAQLKKQSIDAEIILAASNNQSLR